MYFPGQPLSIEQRVYHATFPKCGMLQAGQSKLYYRMDEFGILLVLRGAISKFGTKSCYLGH